MDLSLMNRILSLVRKALEIKFIELSRIYRVKCKSLFYVESIKIFRIENMPEKRSTVQRYGSILSMYK